MFGWTVDEALSFRLLDAWVDAGMNFIDTADVYSRWVPGHAGGESEAILGKWFRQSGKRNRVVLATKVGMAMGDTDQDKGLSKAYIRRAVEASLRRLKTDVIDLYQSHTDDATTPLEETLGAFAELIKEGKVRAIGASNYSAARLGEALALSAAHGLPRYETLQPLYNLMERAAVRGRARAGAASRTASASSTTTRWRAAFSPASTAAAPIWERACAAAARRSTSNERGLAVLGALDAVAGTRRRHARPGGAGLADRPAEHHRADRQRQLAGAARRARRRGAAAPRRAVASS